MFAACKSRWRRRSILSGLSEVIYVDDGSRDRSFEILRELASGNPRMRLIRFRRNFGQTPAMAAGFDAARGEVIVPLDADLAERSGGYPAPPWPGWRKATMSSVAGGRSGRIGASRPRSSMIANALIARSTGVRIHDYGCTLKALIARPCSRMSASTARCTASFRRGRRWRARE